MEHRGAWMEINKGMINDFIILNPGVLNDRNKKGLCNLFNKINN